MTKLIKARHRTKAKPFSLRHKRVEGEDSLDLGLVANIGYKANLLRNQLPIKK